MMSVACNVYISAGRAHHAELLLRLLHRAQALCRSLRLIADDPVALVHAYADGPYDRSSFHLAGGAGPVATVATELARGAIEGLLRARTLAGKDASRHPFVGLVDHIAVMPLVSEDDGTSYAWWRPPSSDNHFVTKTTSGWAARQIGNAMEKIGAEVHFYGTAHPDGTPLATVRREQTHFFRSGGLDEGSDRHTKPLNGIGIATVGAPSTFVENYNVRLTAACSHRVARTLTTALRERDGGLLGVEALTLPYSEGRFEIACNLLRPHLASSSAIEKKIDEWVEHQQRESPSNGQARKRFIDQSYCVGTTAVQCLDVLALSQTKEGISQHDDEVTRKLRRYLST